MKHARLLACAVAVMGLMALPAMADAIIYDNGTPDHFGAHESDSGYPYEMAADFVLGAGANVITGVNWWGAYAFFNTPSDDDFTLYFYTDAGGIPSPVAFMEVPVGAPSRVAAGGTVWGIYDIYAYSANIAPLALTPGETYFMSIVNNTPSGDFNNWVWPTSAVFVGDLVPGRFGINDGSPWESVTPVPAELAFNLTGRGESGVVPEPASALLFGFGLAGFAVRRFRNR